MQRARDLMERLLRVASPLGLYAEEYDFETGRHLGNFPQAFSHLARYRGRGADDRPHARAFLTMCADLIILRMGAGGGTLQHEPVRLCETGVDGDGTRARRR
jgi:hypothetical protein